MSGRVVVAHEEASIRKPAMDVARGLGCDTVGVTSGQSALTLLSWSPPDVLVTDVSLPDILGFELCEQIARMGLVTKVIFIASVYSKTAYKRRPTSLYGAVDYIEQHHIVDGLGDKLVRALPALSAKGREVGDDTMNRERGAIATAGLRRLKFDAQGLEPLENARRLARLLVADVLLYAGAAGREWLEHGAEEDEMPEQLAGDLAEAKRLFEAEVPPAARGARDFIDEAIAQAKATVR